METKLDEELSDKEIELEASRQLHWPVLIKKTHISEIKAGDLIFHEGLVRTVSIPNIKRKTFMGDTVFGDSYRSGYKLVDRVVYPPLEETA
jgi:hypothetical protein